MTAEDLQRARERLARQGLPVDGATDDQLRAGLEMMEVAFREMAPLSAAGAAKQILDGVRNERWRILVGDDAVAIDRMVREAPEDAYEPAFLERLRKQGFFGGLFRSGVGSPGEGA
jgi:hypothetical protein